jgi:ubiquitin carboxyl-terminal hydrolase L5
LLAALAKIGKLAPAQAKAKEVLKEKIKKRKESGEAMDED